MASNMNFFIVSLIKSALVAFVLLTALAYIQWVERKVLAHIQLRIGPRRVGPHGLLQPLADVIKLLTKEDMLPSHVNKFFYFLAPFIAVMFALISIAVIPFGTEVKIGSFSTPMQLTDLNIGVLFILGLSGVGVYGVALAGWASNNKYSLIGGLRSSAQMISYELPDGHGDRRASADAQLAQLPRTGRRPGRILFRLHPALGHFSRTLPADPQLRASS